MNAEIVQLSGIGMVAAIPDLELSALDGIAGDTFFNALKLGLRALKKVAVEVSPGFNATSCGMGQRITWLGTLISVTL